MLILLPPSEGKAEAGTGRRLDLSRLSLPELTPAREEVLAALVTLCAGPDEPAARAALGLSEGQRGELRRNARLREAASAPAGRIYTGVLYEALDLATLPPAAERLARRSVLISSGLWGAVRLTDRIPPYRCPVGAKLPGVGALSAYWRRALEPAMAAAAGSGPVLDLRSGAYAATWTPRGAVADRTVTVRVLHEREVDGLPTRSVVSHFNKATKGRLVRDLLTAGARPRTAAALVGALRDLKYTVEEQPVAAGRPRQLDIVVTEL
ncbi:MULTISPECIES: peroxide stress protein YaaA [Micromonospora]|uniref:Peroxide stress protein YaaA n=1 Tax=Micromonospora solifontis TaxID=2487138 RepID=A0ABX9WIV5_9ACTN|nr:MULTISPECIES: peroxide stress protein YaaA [Micromonospora]NES15497.1 peroxide stress protein YaaA [Micromonospora sp. PPF5-17B]NES36933.1 peroxide stress protein YaaA [Micromonospora solifontis]NES55276.1 peroxide stress protein YaaA [Micromonospora sp. PPF5-6]RNL98977.1 peroxide stress protein YaaA [Micromonospora solifontis]